MILGFIFSIIVSILFSVYAVPRKYSKQNVILYTMFMGIAYFIGSIIIVSILWGFRIEEPENLLNIWHLLTISRGFVWVLGMAAYNLAIDKIGLTRFNQWKNIQGPVGALLMLSFFPDIEGTRIIWLLLGMAVMFISALTFQISTEDEKKDISRSRANCRSGIIFALFSGVCFGVSALLNSIVSRPSIVGESFIYSQLLYHSASLIFFSVIFYMILGNRSSSQKPEPLKERFKNMISIDKKTWLPVIAGSMFLVATLLTIFSYRLIPNPVAWSITQLNVFWTVLIGLFIFKEIDYKKHWLRLIAGVLSAVGACILLFFAL